MKIFCALGYVLLSCAGMANAQAASIQVRDRTGSAIEGARVEFLIGSAVAATATTATTDENGTAGASLAEGTYRARVTAHGFVVGLSAAFAEGADSVATIEVTLFPGSALAGTVLDGDGDKVSGAKLCLSLHDSRNYPPYAFGEGLFEESEQCWESDANGQLVTPVLPLGRYDLTLEAENLVARETTLVLEADFSAKVWQLEQGGRIRGLVQDREGIPVATAAVRLRHRELESEREGVTGPEGRFEVAGLAAGPWTVRVEPRNAAVILRDGISVKEGAATDLGLLRVQPGLSIDGAVLDAHGNPLPDARITARRAGRVNRPIRTVTSDDEGRFVAAGLGEASVNLLIEAPEGHASAALEDVEPPKRNLEIELEATGTVCGFVSTEEGRAPLRTSVTALPRDLGPLDDYEEFTRATTRDVDPDSGRFCIEDVYPAEGVSVTASAAGYRDASAEADVTPGQESGPVELLLRRGLSLEGTVVAPGGQPLHDTAVRGRATAMVYTDGFGEFRLTGLAEGMNTVIAEHPDYAVAERDVMLPLGLEEVFRIELGAGGTIEGSVRRTGGEPVEGVPILLSDPDRERLTDVDGLFRFVSVPSGERSLTRKARGRYDDFERRRIEVVEGEAVQVEFTLGAVLEGQVVRGGVPVPGVTIALAQPRNVAEYTDGNHAVQRTFSDESGSYRLSGVRAGWGTVTLEDGRQAVVRQIEVPPGDTPHLDLGLPDQPISGSVVSKNDGSGIGDAHVSITLAQTAGGPQTSGSSSYSSSDSSGGIFYNLTSNAEATTTTDAAGNFEAYADALPEIEVRAGASGFRSTNVTTEPGRREPLLIELPRETKLVVHLRDARGNPASGVRVCAVRQSDDGNQSSSCTMGGNDRVEFSLDEGNYKIQASATGFGTQVFERELKRREDGSATEVTVDLVPGAPLDIRLVGSAVEEASVVSLIDPTGAERSDLVRPESLDPSTGDMRWTTWNLNPGVWTLTLDAGGGKAIKREIEVLPGAPIEVVLP